MRVSRLPGWMRMTTTVPMSLSRRESNQSRQESAPLLKKRWVIEEDNKRRSAFLSRAGCGVRVCRVCACVCVGGMEEACGGAWCVVGGTGRSSAVQCSGRRL